MTAAVQPASAYRACVDPLHRNVWPVRVGEACDNDASDPVIGYLTEHITVNLDGAEPPHVAWSWEFNDAEADRLKLDPELHRSPARYPTWRDALETFVGIHRLATRGWTSR